MYIQYLCVTLKPPELHVSCLTKLGTHNGRIIVV